MSSFLANKNRKVWLCNCSPNMSWRSWWNVGYFFSLFNVFNLSIKAWQTWASNTLSHIVWAKTSTVFFGIKIFYYIFHVFGVSFNLFWSYQQFFEVVLLKSKPSSFSETGWCSAWSPSTGIGILCTSWFRSTEIWSTSRETELYSTGTEVCSIWSSSIWVRVFSTVEAFKSDI